MIRGEKCLYQGRNRPHLFGIVGEVKAVKTDDYGPVSALVDFDGDEEWVSVYSLRLYIEPEPEPVQPSLKDTVTALFAACDRVIDTWHNGTLTEHSEAVEALRLALT